MSPVSPLQALRRPLLELQRRTTAWTPWTLENAEDPQAWRRAATDCAELCSLWRRFFGKTARDSSPNSPIHELAKLARLELRRCAEELQKNSERTDKWRALQTCQGIRRRFISASVAVRRQLRSLVENIDDPDETFVAELALSLNCRRELARLWTNVESTQGKAADRRIRLAGSSIAALRGANAYPSLNPRDRLTLLELQQRILTWLRAPNPDEGAALMLDLEGIVAITRQISRRFELQEHDAFTLPTCMDELTRLGSSGQQEVPTESLTTMRLFGMDTELDSYLRGAHANVGDVGRVLRSLSGSFDIEPGQTTARADELLAGSALAESGGWTG